MKGSVIETNYDFEIDSCHEQPFFILLRCGCLWIVLNLEVIKGF